MLRLVCAVGFAVLAYAVPHAASTFDLPKWAGLAGAGVLLMLAISTLAFGPFARRHGTPIQLGPSPDGPSDQPSPRPRGPGAPPA
jgi:MFS family permease